MNEYDLTLGEDDGGSTSLAVLPKEPVDPDEVLVNDLLQRVAGLSHHLKKEAARHHNVVVIGDSLGTRYKLEVACLSGLRPEAKREISRLLGIYNASAIKFTVFEMMHIEMLLSAAYEAKGVAIERAKVTQKNTRGRIVWSADTSNEGLPFNNDATDIGEMRGGRLDLTDMAEYEAILEKVTDGSFDINKLNTLKFVTFMLTDFVLSGGSDLHAQAARSGGRIRYRFQGEVYTRFDKIPIDKFRQIVSSLCTLGAKDANNMKHGLVQTVIKLKILLEGEKKDVEFRFQSLPTVHCPSVILRGQTKPMTDINKLGLTLRQIEQLRAAYRQDHGIVLITGPTGSGKTNTLNCMFRELEDEDTRVIVETGDPIEIESDRRVQINISEYGSEKSVDALYEKVFKACLRADPDVVSFTEVRNSDVAKIALRAANTGHMVFTTMHAADAEEVFGRLFEMGLSRDMVAKGILAILAQTLIRKLCELCRIKDEEESLLAGRDIYRDNPLGCAACHGGFSGRTVVAEVLTIDETVKEAVIRGDKPADIIKLAIASGAMIPMKHIARDKILEGITSKGEVDQMVELETSTDSEYVDMEMPDSVVVQTSEDDEGYFTALPVIDAEEV